MTTSTGQSSEEQVAFHLSLDELTLLHLALKQLNQYERAKDKKLACSLALRLHSFLASERTRRADEGY